MVLQPIKSRNFLSLHLDTLCVELNGSFSVALTVKICYRYQNADWRLRPLPEEMVRYKRRWFLSCCFSFVPISYTFVYIFFSWTVPVILLHYYFSSLVIFAWMHLI